MYTIWYRIADDKNNQKEVKEPFSRWIWEDEYRLWLTDRDKNPQKQYAYH